MEINILAFGQIRDITGHSSMKIGGVKNTNEVGQKLIELYPALRPLKYSLAVNKRIVQENTDLNDGDTVALLPPYSGG